MTLLFRQQGLLSSLSICAALALAIPAANAQPSASPSASAPTSRPAADPSAPAPSPSAAAPNGSESPGTPAAIAQDGDKSAPPSSTASPPANTNTNEPSRSRLQWNERWPRFSLVEHVGMGVAAVGAIAANSVPARNTGRWDNAFDSGIRDAVRAESYSARRTMATTSDLFYYGLMAYPFLVDTIFVAGLRNTDVAWQMTVMNLSSFAYSGFLAILPERVFGRERPFFRECAADPTYDPDCGAGEIKTHVSFPSGHTIMASTGAGLICAHHLNLPLYGGGWPDTLACGTAVTLAAFQGFFRITADRHYATDVIAFSLVGFSSGYLLPTLLHYRNRNKNTKSPPRVSVAPYASDTGGGLIASGIL